MSTESESRPDSDLPLMFDGSAAPAKKAAKKTARKATKKAAKKAAPAAAPAESAPAEAPSKPEVSVADPRPKAEAPPRREGEFRPNDFKGRGSHFDDAARSQAQPEALRSEERREERPAPRQDERDEGRGDDRPPPRRDSRPEQRNDDRPEPRTDNRPEQRGDNRPEQRVDNRPEQRGDDRPEQRGDDRPEQRGDDGPGSGHQKRPHGQHGQQRRDFQQGGGNKQNRFQKGGKDKRPGQQGQPFVPFNKKDNRPQNRPQQGGGWRQPPPPTDRGYVEGELPAVDHVAKFELLEKALAELDVSAPIDLATLYELHVDKMAAAARELGLTFEEKPGRRQILEDLFKLGRETKRAFSDSGFLDVADEGHGFVVHTASNYQLKPESVYVPAALISRFSLKRGHQIDVLAGAPAEGERCPAAVKIVSAMGMEPEEMAKVTVFEDLTPYYPTERMVLETPMPSNSKKDVSMRVFDLLTPIGFGQRGLIVAPPRTGKTVLLQGLANSIQENYPEVHLIVLLVDERPEEVTDFRRQTKGEVISSTFDESPTSHVHAAEMVVEKARRMCEMGQKVVILLDSITRLARAYNALASNSGKIMSGGIEATALQKPKRFFGAARNIEGGGSITIMGTALIDTGSKMDEVIFEEFKGTGNMETHLDRDLINKRIFPAINFERSGTRKEELLYHPQELEKVYGLRRVMQGVPGTEAMEMLIKRLKVTKNNVEFLMSLK